MAYITLAPNLMPIPPWGLGYGQSEGQSGIAEYLCPKLNVAATLAETNFYRQRAFDRDRDIILSLVMVYVYRERVYALHLDHLPIALWTNHMIGIHFGFTAPHRAFAAFAAIWERLRGLRASALAAPPLRPPRRPRATAWGFLAESGTQVGWDRVG